MPALWPKSSPAQPRRLGRRVRGLVGLVACLAACHGRGENPAAGQAADAYAWTLPPGFVPPKVPADNPMTQDKVLLGRYLFYDVRLSQNQTQSCASCHRPDLAFTDGRPRALGSTGQYNRRGAPTLINVAYLTSYTWANPLLQTLEAQAMVPIFGRTPVELGSTDVQEMLARFRGHKGYQRLFRAAYPKDAAPITLANLVRALACFERSLISAQSPYDKFFFGGDGNALSAAARRGNVLFFSEKLECNHCHSGFNLMDATQTARTKQANLQFHNTALYNVDGQGGYPAEDKGLLDISQQAADDGRFRAQTLRNIALTAPYFHDGSAQTLDDVLDHYAAGGRRVATGPNAGDGQKSPRKSAFMIGFALSTEERADLHAFFASLTDATIASNPNFLPPPPLPDAE